MSVAHFSCKIRLDSQTKQEVKIPSHLKPFSQGDWTIHFTRKEDQTSGSLRLTATRFLKDEYLKLRIQLQLESDRRVSEIWIGDQHCINKLILSSTSDAGTLSVACSPKDEFFNDVPKATATETNLPDPVWAVVNVQVTHREQGSLTPGLTPDLFFGEVSRDVRIILSAEDISIAAHSQVLKRESPYFNSLLKSGFSESAGRSSTSKQVSSSSSAPCFEDSDAEEELGCSCTGKNKDDGSDGNVEASMKEEGIDQKDPNANVHSNATEVPSLGGEALRDLTSTATYREEYVVRLQSTSHRTMRATLYWMYTGEINFTFLSSNVHLTPEGMSLTYDPPSASPKSVYRLAHFLDMPKLTAKALEAIKHQLNIDNAATELFGDVAATYKEVRELELEFAIKNWDEVKESKGMKEIEAMIEDNKLPNALAVYVELAKGLKKGGA